jgi:hypothetical protein
MKPKDGVEVVLYSFFKLGTRWGWVVIATPQPLCPPGKRPVAHWIEGYSGPRSGLDGCVRFRLHRDPMPRSSSP